MIFKDIGFLSLIFRSLSFLIVYYYKSKGSTLIYCYLTSSFILSRGGDGFTFPTY